MTRATRFSLALLAASAFAAGPLARTAQAEPPGGKTLPVYVLSIHTDDSDDQADALTQALRSRVRQAQHWSLLDANQSFDMLSIALKCPSRPDAACLQRIGDQIHADHFVWGTMAKKHGGEVTADLHMWTRGKGDTSASDTYSDNLKDASDDSLRAIAARLFGRLTGTAASGTLVVHAGSGGGMVLVDGNVKGTLVGGVARIDAPAGAHAVNVRVPGFDSIEQTENVPLGGEQDVTFSLSPSAPAPSGSASHTAFPARKVLSYAAIVVGAGLLVASGVETAAWINDDNASNNDRKPIPSNVNDVCGGNVPASLAGNAQDACQKSKDAVTVSALAWTFGGIGAALVGTGTLLLLTDHHGTEGPPPEGAQAKARVDVIPEVGPRSGSVGLRVVF